MSYLITGSSGFVAGHLIEHIFRNDDEAVITCLDLIEPDYSFLDEEMLSSISFIKTDLLSINDLLKTLESAHPRFIIHLAFRDFVDVRDVVKAYLLLLSKGTSGEVYNVCSRTGRTIEECLNALIGIADIRCDIRKSDSLARPVDNPVIVGDNGKINARTGWSPEISFESGLTDLFDYWMARL